MKIYIVVGSVREGRTAIKVAHWVLQEIKKYGFSTLETELVDLKEWDLPLFAGSHPPLTGIYDQPKQQEWADFIALADAFIFISPEYNHGYSPALKNAWIIWPRNGKANRQLISVMASPTAHVPLIRSVRSALSLAWWIPMRL